MIVESSLHLSGSELAALISACVGTPVLGVIAVMRLQATRLSKADAERAKQFEGILKAQAERTAAQDAERSSNFMLLLREREATAQRRDDAMERAMKIFGDTERRAHETQLIAAQRTLEVSASLNKLTETQARNGDTLRDLADAQARYVQLLRGIAEVQVRHDELLRRIANERESELHQPTRGE